MVVVSMCGSNASKAYGNAGSVNAITNVLNGIKKYFLRQCLKGRDDKPTQKWETGKRMHVTVWPGRNSASVPRIPWPEDPFPGSFSDERASREGGRPVFHGDSRSFHLRRHRLCAQSCSNTMRQRTSGRAR